MKHAYLIMAHDQFYALKELVSVLDDPRNDIFIHFDKKVKNIPEDALLSRKKGNGKLVVLGPKKRINVIWGDVSQIKAEYALLRCAYEFGEKWGKYDYYHIISGTHFPLKSNDELHRWFDSCNGACVLRPVPLEEEEIQMRFGLYHFFMKHLISKNKFVNKAYHLGWRAMLSIQKRLGIKRDTSFIKGKASQWCSLNEEAVSLLLKNEKIALKQFRRSFCCDEFFVRSLIEDSGIPIIYDDRICYVDFVWTTPKYFTEGDFQMLMETGALFFRKMSDSNLGLAKMIEQRIKQ